MVEVDTSRYEREHGRKPTGRRFWRFTIVSPSVTTKDHHYDPQEALTYAKALEMAENVAKLRRSTRIIVEP